MRRLFKNIDGGVAIYAAFVSALVIGSGVLVFDWGKAIVLKAQMQNAADSMAMSAAKELDGLPGARDRATAVADDTLVHGSFISDSSGAFTMTGASPKFFLLYDRASPLPGTSGYCQTAAGGSIGGGCDTVEVTSGGDNVVSIVEVRLVAEDVSIVLKPIVDMISNVTSGVNAFQVSARAVAQRSDVGCDVAPFFVCNPDEDGSKNRQFHVPGETQGRQMVIKDGAGQNNPTTPGNFGVLCPEVNADGSCASSGADDVQDALILVDTDICYTGGVTTEPGNMQNKVADGVNVRFDEQISGQTCNPNHPNGQECLSDQDIMGYYKDSDVAGFDENTDSTAVNGGMGNRDWNADAHWQLYHNAGGGGGNSPPAVFDLDSNGSIDSDVSRYQYYLWERDLSFCRNGGQTEYTLDGNPSGGVGWTCFNGTVAEDPGPPANTNQAAGTTPTNLTATPSSQRRVMTVAVVNCTELANLGFDIAGRTENIPVTGGYVDFFVTECACDTGGSCNNPSSICDAGYTGGGGGDGLPKQNGSVYSEVIGPTTETVNSGLIVTNVRLID